MGKRKLVASDPCQSKIQKLSMFGFSSNSGSEHSTPPAQASNSVKIVKPSTPKRKFNISWKFNRNWLRYDSKLGLMFCDLCISANVQNVFTEGCSIRDSLSQRSEAVRACSSFIETVKASLQSRFTDSGDAKILSALSRFFDPQCFSDRTPPSEDMDVIAKHLSVCKVGEVRECRVELGNFVEFCRARLQANPKAFLSSTDVCQVAFRARELFPIVAAAAGRLITAPVSTADCERGFSRQNLIKTDVRSCLKPTTLENLMRLSINSGKEEVDYEEAFRKWSSLKARRIFHVNFNQ